MKRLATVGEILLLAQLIVLSLSQGAWAGPPGPPVILAPLPSVPVGGPEVTIATTALIAGYGLWKSRK